MPVSFPGQNEQTTHAEDIERNERQNPDTLNNSLLEKASI
jgi:hypothetical protein